MGLGFEIRGWLLGGKARLTRMYSIEEGAVPPLLLHTTGMLRTLSRLMYLYKPNAEYQCC
jgi:hypothetical protein